MQAGKRERRSYVWNQAPCVQVRQKQPGCMVSHLLPYRSHVVNFLPGQPEVSIGSMQIGSPQRSLPQRISPRFNVLQSLSNVLKRARCTIASMLQQQIQGLTSGIFHAAAENRGERPKVCIGGIMTLTPRIIDDSFKFSFSKLV